MKEIRESSRSNLQNVIFNIPDQGKSKLLSLFEYPLTHIIPKREVFRERIKVFHSLFCNHNSFNSLVQLQD